MVSPLDRLTQLSAALDQELLKTGLPVHEDEALGKIFIRSVKENDSFVEVKDTRFSARVKRFFSRIFSPQRYDLAANLSELQQLFTQVKSEDVAKLEPFIEKVEKIKKHAIDSLEDKAKTKNSASLDDRIKTLKSITFPHTAKKVTPPLAGISLNKIDNDLLIAAIKESLYNMHQLDLKALEIIPDKYTESKVEELKKLKKDLKSVSNATELLLLEVNHDPKLTKTEKENASSALRTGYDRLGAHISKIDTLLKPKEEPGEVVSGTTVVAEAGSHQQVGGKRYYIDLSKVVKSATPLIITQLALNALASGSTHLPTIALTLAAPFVAAFAAKKISERLPTAIAPYAESAIQPIATILMVRYGVSFVSGSMAYLVSTKQTTEPLSLEFRNETASANMPEAPSPNITVPASIQPISNLTEPLPMSLLSDKPLDIPLQVTPIPQEEVTLPIAHEQTSGGAWGDAWAWGADKASRIFKGYMRTYEQSTVQTNVVSPELPVEGQVISVNSPKIRNL